MWWVQYPLDSLDFLGRAGRNGHTRGKPQDTVEESGLYFSKSDPAEWRRPSCWRRARSRGLLDLRLVLWVVYDKISNGQGLSIVLQRGLMASIGHSVDFRRSEFLDRDKLFQRRIIGVRLGVGNGMTGTRPHSDTGPGQGPPKSRQTARKWRIIVKAVSYLAIHHRRQLTACFGERLPIPCKVTGLNLGAISSHDSVGLVGNVFNQRGHRPRRHILRCDRPHPQQRAVDFQTAVRGSSQLPRCTY